PVLIDFGAARPEYRFSMTAQQFRLDYAPVELLLGEEVGPETDIYELAIVTYELLRGERPISGLAQLQGKRWESAHLPSPWSERFDSALRMRREDRPTSVREWWAGQAPQLPAPPADTRPTTGPRGSTQPT